MLHKAKEEDAKDHVPVGVCFCTSTAQELKQIFVFKALKSVHAVVVEHSNFSYFFGWLDIVHPKHIAKTNTGKLFYTAKI